MKLEKNLLRLGFGMLPSDEWYARFYCSCPYERSPRAALGDCVHRYLNAETERATALGGSPPVDMNRWGLL